MHVLWCFDYEVSLGLCFLIKAHVKKEDEPSFKLFILIKT